VVDLIFIQGHIQLHVTRV